jgi:hypothetical protein
MDDKLSWNGNNTSSRYITMDSAAIWTPRLSLLSSSGHDEQLLSGIPVVVSQVGIIRWLSKTRVTSTCDLTFYSFPFDHHRCTLIIGSWFKEVNLHPVFRTSRDEGKTSDWRITSSLVAYADSNERQDGVDPHLEVVIEFSRNCGTYHQLFKPALLALVFTSLISFWMSPQCLKMRVSVHLFSIALSFFTLWASVQIIGFQEQSQLQTFLTWIVVISLVDCLSSFFLFFFVNQTFKTPVPLIIAYVIKSPVGKILLLEQTAVAFLTDYPKQSESSVQDGDTLCLFLREEWLLFAVFIDRIFFLIQLSFLAIELIF